MPMNKGHAHSNDAMAQCNHATIAIVVTTIEWSD